MGMDERFWTFAESDLKGRIAESLVESMLVRACSQVFRTGQEHTARIPLRSNRAHGKPRCDQDFEIVNGDYRDRVEVKFRRQGRFYPEDQERLEELRANGKPKLVLVSYIKPYFVVDDYPYNLDERGYPTDTHPIFEEKAWGIKKEDYAVCVRLLLAYKPKRPQF